MSEREPIVLPPEGTVERWAWDYILTMDLGEKLSPRPVPTRWEANPSARRLLAPGRPAALRLVAKAPKTRGLRSPLARARALHTFLHHELQAAELMAWALLAFVETPREFREGLLRIASDEVRHMGMYAAHIERLGHGVGDFPVRDWFWERVPSAQSPVAFVATMGLGFEGANLDHSRSFALRFREVGDDQGARLQELVGEEEIAHVRFGARWFRELSGDLTFSSWRAELPAPLSPLLMRGRPLQREARARAGLPDSFLDELAAWTPE